MKSPAASSSAARTASIAPAPRRAACAEAPAYETAGPRADALLDLEEKAAVMMKGMQLLLAHIKDLNAVLSKYPGEGESLRAKSAALAARLDQLLQDNGRR